MTKWLIGALIIIVIAGVAFWYFKFNKQTVEVPPPQQSAAAAEPLTYASSTMGISLNYPASYTLDENYVYTAFPTKPVHGVKFSVPESFITGTNLGADTGVSIEQLPRAKICTGDIYLKADVKASNFTVGSTTYSLATSSDMSGSNNDYEEQVYAIPGSSPCTAVRYFIHSSDVANYPQDTVTPYNRAALLSDFDSIRDSLVLSQ